MSKEQTPIYDDAKHYLMVEGYPNGEKELEEVLEQYAQAKVLEALEPQREFIEELLTIFDGNGVPNIRYVTKLINQYCETEVKPKYEEERK